MDAQAKEIKNKVMCEINSFLLFIFSLMIDSLIKQQTAFLCVYNTKKKQLFFKLKKKEKKENGYNLKIGH